MRVQSATKDAFNVSLGRQIKRYRESSGYSQREVAAMLKASQSLIVNYEDGITAPSAFIVWRLAHIFDCTTDELLIDLPGEGEVSA